MKRSDISALSLTSSSRGSLSSDSAGSSEVTILSKVGQSLEKTLTTPVVEEVS